MTLTEKKYLIRELRRWGPYRKRNFYEIKIVEALKVAIGYYDMHGNPKSRRLRRLAGQP